MSSKVSFTHGPGRVPWGAHRRGTKRAREEPQEAGWGGAGATHSPKRIAFNQWGVFDVGSAGKGQGSPVVLGPSSGAGAAWSDGATVAAAAALRSVVEHGPGWSDADEQAVRDAAAVFLSEEAASAETEKARKKEQRELKQQGIVVESPSPLRYDAGGMMRRPAPTINLHTSMAAAPHQTLSARVLGQDIFKRLLNRNLIDKSVHEIRASSAEKLGTELMHHARELACLAFGVAGLADVFFTAVIVYAKLVDHVTPTTEMFEDDPHSTLMRLAVYFAAVHHSVYTTIATAVHYPIGDDNMSHASNEGNFKKRMWELTKPATSVMAAPTPATFLTNLLHAALEGVQGLRVDQFMSDVAVSLAMIATFTPSGWKMHASDIAAGAVCLAVGPLERGLNGPAMGKILRYRLPGLKECVAKVQAMVLSVVQANLQLMVNDECRPAVVAAAHWNVQGASFTLE